MTVYSIVFISNEICMIKHNKCKTMDNAPVRTLFKPLWLLCVNFRVVLNSFSSLFHNKPTFVDFYAGLLLFKIIKEGLNLNSTDHHTDSLCFT